MSDTKQFLQNECAAIIEQADALLLRLNNHIDYLGNPKLQETHRADVRDHDVVTANFALARGKITEAMRQLRLAQKVTAYGDVKEENEPETNDHE